MEHAFLWCVAKHIHETFPEAQKKVQDPTFGKLAFRLYRNHINRKCVLEKLAALTTGTDTAQLLTSIFKSDPFERTFSDKIWFQTAILQLVGE